MGLKRTVTLEKRSSKKKRRTVNSNGLAPKTWSLSNKTTYRKGFDPFPSSLIARMRYATSKALDTPGTFNMSNWCTMVPTSIHDPDTAVINGHQPTGHDLFTKIYKNYRVVRCIITVQVLDNFSGPIWIQKSMTASPISSTTDFNLERKGTRMMTLAKASTSGDKILRHEYRMGDREDTEGQDWTLFGKNPTTNCFFHVGVGSVGAAVDIPLMITMEYDVEMTGMIDQPSS